MTESVGLISSYIILFCYYILWHFILNRTENEFVKTIMLWIFGFFMMFMGGLGLIDDSIWVLPMMVAGGVWFWWRVGRQ